MVIQTHCIGVPLCLWASLESGVLIKHPMALGGKNPKMNSIFRRLISSRIAHQQGQLSSQRLMMQLVMTLLPVLAIQ